jgi:hypothetical protein
VGLSVAHDLPGAFDGGKRILEIRTSPMPQGGIVTTYSDITDRVEAAGALERANETLERRVRERTAELTEVNQALAVAKRKADEANLDKTRFLAAASHDVLQPLNAARLYVTSLVERSLGGQEATLAHNIDASLEAVEEILGVLIEISRLDTGRLEPDITVFPLNEVFERLKVEFAPLAREKALDLRICHAPGALGSPPLRRVLRHPSPMPSSTPRWQGAGGRRGGRLAFRERYGPGIPDPSASYLQGVPAPGGDGEHGEGPGSRPVDRRAHRQGAGPCHGPAIRSGSGLDLLGGAAPGRTKRREGTGIGRGAVGGTSRRPCRSVHRQ